MEISVAQKDLRIVRKNYLLIFFSGFFIYPLIIPFVLLDISLTVYQAVYFSLYQMPKVYKRDFVVLDRGALKQLNWWQKINCLYCGYANGLLAWARAIANITEAYSCAIKHGLVRRDQEFQKDFYEYEKFR